MSLCFFAFFYVLYYVVKCTDLVDHIEIEAECWDLIKMIPTFHLQSDLPPYLVQMLHGDIADAANISFMEIRRKLVDECIARYYQLLAQHATNEETIKGDLLVSNNSFVTKKKKPNLIVLDVDETLLDQRAEERDRGIFLNSHHFRLQLLATLCHRNKNDLVFGMHRKNDLRDKEHAYVVLFRQFLMHFIHRTRRSSNFVVYSMADASLVIPHIIMIENYYNYVYRLSRDETKNTTRSVTKFKIDYMIGRLRDREAMMIKYKAFTILERLIGDTEQFMNIFVVDDRANDVWLSGWLSSAKIFYLQPPAFSSEQMSRWPHDLIGESVYYREKDNYFHALTYFVKKSYMANETQSWISDDSMRRFLRLHNYLGYVNE